MPRRRPHARGFGNTGRDCRASAAITPTGTMAGLKTAAVRILTLALCGIVSLPFWQASARAQFPSAELSDSVNLDEADSAVRAHLERIKAYVADRQWDEAVETLRQVMENHGAKLIPLTRSRYVNLTDYCQIQIAALPAEGLALYRERVDALAQKWYDEGVTKRNSGRLAEVVDKAFCSSWGDDALLALGELELEQAHYGAARRHWERLIEVPPARISAERFEAARQAPGLDPSEAALLDKWYTSDPAATIKIHELRTDEILPDEVSGALVRLWKRRVFPLTRLAYPGTSIPLADIRARLILVSILEGSLSRAQQELKAFERLHPDAKGHLAGRDVNYREALTKIISAAESWPEPKSAENWPTYAGSYSRNRIAPRNLDLGPRAWDPIGLGAPLSADSANSRAYSLRRIGEDAQRLLSYHPVVDGNLVLVCNQSQIFAFDLRTGKPAFPRSDPKRPPGEIFDQPVLIPPTHFNRGLGVPRFTMTVHDHKLYARMGSQVTSRPLEVGEQNSGSLVCLDLAAEGKIIWNISPNDKNLPDEDKWAFEGSPVVDGGDVYIAMRKSDVRPQTHVACFDAETGLRRWRSLVCAAETPGGGQAEEITHNLLSFDQGMLYYNTNLGAVAAVSAREGRVQWVTRYPRAKKARPDGQDKRAAHFYRDLNPCIYYRGSLLVAPADCDSIFAIDAASGELIWDSHLPEDVVHLLGVGKGNLLASGDRLWWIDVERGKIVARWPDTTPVGYGRGILMGDQVIWPTADALYVFQQDGSTQRAALRDPIPLAQGRDATGGNLVAVEGLLLIATPDKLFAFEQHGKEPAAGETRNVARQNTQKKPPVPERDEAGRIRKVVSG